MAGIASTFESESEGKELTIRELLNTQTIPIIAQTCLNQADQNPLYQNLIHESKEVFLQSIMRVKYARIKVLDFHTTDKVRDEKGEEYLVKHNRIVGKHYLIPVKYKGKLKFVHRPGRRRRYISASQVLEDPPRYITVFDDTPAVLCTPKGKCVLVPPNSNLEVVRKVKRSSTGSTYLECSDGQTLFAFGEHDRLNCTAVDDTKFYNLFELVRTKFLPRVVQFATLQTDDITHVDEASYSTAISVVEGPIELQGFEDRVLLIGWVRNESKQNYETILIPQNIWTTLIVVTESLQSKKETLDYVEHFYGPCDRADFVEKSLYLMSPHQDKVLRLIRPDFKGGILHNWNTEYVEAKGRLYLGPVVLLPQVKKKKSLFKKVHTELLRWFKSKDEDSTQQRNQTQRKGTSPSVKQSKGRKTKNRMSRSVSFGDLRRQPKTLIYRRIKYGDDASYMEFYHNNPRIVLPVQEHCRLSMSLGDISSKIISLPDNVEDNAYNNEAYFSEKIFGSVNAEIPDNFGSREETRERRDIIADTRGKQRVSEKKHQLKTQQSVLNTVEAPTIGIEPTQGDTHQCNTLAVSNKEHVFYRYTDVETVQCLIQCGLPDLAEQCQEHKLNGAFFRNLGFDALKEDPFYLSDFNILKLRKIIREGWRSS